MTKAIMIQGTGSNVGKSLIVAGLARHFADRGLKVAPFKPQNMSNNAAVTTDGGEIGRAQALQARAARVPASVDMNPVLLKPQSDTGAQVIVQGQRHGTLDAREYGAQKAQFLPMVVDSFERLSSRADLVLIEGAGSPAEVNLRAGDIANMGFARAVGAPVILVGDIDKGGVIAQMAGTHAVLDRRDRDQIKGFIINKFRGDVDLFRTGEQRIAEITGWQRIGTLPWFDRAAALPAEDIMDIRPGRGAGIKIAVPRLGRIANFDDLDPLAAEPGVTLDIVEPGRALPGDAALVLIPGSKSTIADMHAFRANGWDIDLAAHIRRGGHVLGICGGYQMLGRQIIDPEGIEGQTEPVTGLGFLDIETRMGAAKRLGLVEATDTETTTPVQGYEIHIGESTGPDCKRGWLDIGGARHGAQSADGRIRGAYLHGLFASDPFRAAYLARIGGRSEYAGYEAGIEAALDALAAHMAAHLDLDGLLEIAASPAVT